MRVVRRRELKVELKSDKTGWCEGEEVVEIIWKCLDNDDDFGMVIFVEFGARVGWCLLTYRGIAYRYRSNYL